MKLRLTPLSRVDVELTDPNLLALFAGDWQNVNLPLEEAEGKLEQALLDLAARQPVRQFELDFISAVCRSCGCDDSKACVGGCSWVEPDLCSACQQRNLGAIFATAADRSASPTNPTQTGSEAASRSPQEATEA